MRRDDYLCAVEILCENEGRAVTGAEVARHMDVAQQSAWITLGKLNASGYLSQRTTRVHYSNGWHDVIGYVLSAKGRAHLDGRA